MIGVRREDKNKWERRVPLTPDDVATLVRAGYCRRAIPGSDTVGGLLTFWACCAGFKGYQGDCTAFKPPNFL